VIIDKALNSKYVNIYGVDGVVEIVHDKIVTEKCGAIESDRLYGTPEQVALVAKMFNE
jgi:hypothetical protein